jgi:hypothetical protein
VFDFLVELGRNFLERLFQGLFLILEFEAELKCDNFLGI